MLYKWRKEYDKFGSGSFPNKVILKQSLEEKLISELETKLKTELVYGNKLIPKEK
jgi:transposase